MCNGTCQVPLQCAHCNSHMHHETGGFKAVGHFEAKFYGLLDMGMAILQLCLWKFSHKETVEDYIQLKLTFILKNEKSLYEPRFGGLRGNICTPSIAR